MSSKNLKPVVAASRAADQESQAMPADDQDAAGDGIPDDVIERLRLSRQESDEQNRELGETAGRDWALHHADYEELEALQEFHDDMEGNPYGHDWDALFDDDDHDPAGALFEAIQPEAKGDVDVCREFWERFGGSSQGRLKGPEFFRGFAEEAFEVWYEVPRRM